ncbi:MAG: MFS transporter [Candidatus Solibacter usitatus]|nr:MFS transporter [Candidatus Solibacter usitatus]
MLNKMDPQYTKTRWGVLALLFLSILVNLLDRQVLAVVAPVLRDELHLSNTQYSYIVTAFMLGLALMQVPSGMLIDKIGPRIGLSILMIWWSAANALHALARTLGHFIGLRFLLGAGECGNYSAGVKVISQRFPQNERALAGGIFNSGTVIGSFLAPYFIVSIMNAYGWRWAFVLPSVLGLTWLVPWLLFYRDRESASQSASEPAVPLLPLLSMRQVWGAMFIRAFMGPAQHFYWNWLPEYLKRERHFSMDMIGKYAGIPFLFAGLGNLAGGLFAGYLMRKGLSADATRKIIFGFCCTLCLISSAVPAAPGEISAMAMICTATFALGAGVSNHIALLTDLFSPRVMARMTGLAGMCEGVVNIAVTLATGRVVDSFGYVPVFAAAGVMPMIALASLFFLIRRVERL